MRLHILAAGVCLLIGCSKPPATPPADSPAPDAAAEGPSDVAERPELTAEACEAAGGHVVGDIGDGAIHEPDYRCPESGEPPIGAIEADPTGPMAVEGAVCCQ